MSDKLVESVDSNVQHGHEEIQNNNRYLEDSTNGDTNGNKVNSKDGQNLETTGAMDKVIIWGTNSQYDDPELAEFEMLECQELEAYLVESGDNNGGKDGTIPGTMNLTQTEIEVQNDVIEISKSEKTIKETNSDKVISKDIEACMTKTENSSENDVFVSCYSTMSSLASQSCLTSSDKCKNAPHTEGTRVDLNFNNTTSEEPILEAQEPQPVQKLEKQKSTETKCNGTGNPTDLEYVSKDHAEHLVDAAQDHMISKEEREPITTQQYSVDLHNTVAQDDGTELKNNQLQRMPSSDLVLKDSTQLPAETSSQCGIPEARLYQKQTLSDRTRTGCSSSIDGRAPWCSSPRPATAPSSELTGSPRRQQPSSPAKTISTKTCDSPGSPQRFTSGLKPPSKSYFSSGIPKPIPPQQPSKTETDSLKSSSPQKPKNVRPKIITYVRRSPQVKPHTTESLYEASTLPSRFTPISITTVIPNQRVGRPRGSPELNTFNGSYDMYGQEVQKPGYYNPSGVTVSGIRPSSQTVPHKMVGKSESFHGELRDKYSKEVRMNDYNYFSSSISYASDMFLHMFDSLSRWEKVSRLAHMK